VRAVPDKRDPRIRRTPAKTEEWSEPTEKAQHLLTGISSELSLSRVVEDFDPIAVHHLRTILSRIDHIRQEIRRIEPRLREIVVIEREWWKL
jgi:hypothetical protein